MSTMKTRRSAARSQLPSFSEMTTGLFSDLSDDDFDYDPNGLVDDAEAKVVDVEHLPDWSNWKVSH